ncbi:hypothetical protein MAP00_003897 [Monascus purpureus]|nr:hypothetical protein MAP00_003897 [Monascus purpureus]
MPHAACWKQDAYNTEQMQESPSERQRGVGIGHVVRYSLRCLHCLLIHPRKDDARGIARPANRHSCNIMWHVIQIPRGYPRQFGYTHDMRQITQMTWAEKETVNMFDRGTAQPCRSRLQRRTSTATPRI